MKILLICSKAFYGRLQETKEVLQQLGHEIFMPNCWDCPETEAQYRGTPQHAEFKAKMYKQSEEAISHVDAVLVLNYNKNGQANYIGGATFLELYDAFRHDKKIFFMNKINECV